MKTYYFVVIFILHISQGLAQIKFEKGYIIDNQGNKKDCLIKNIDWKNNPSDFEYKINGIIKKGNLNIIQEFEITGYSKYVRAEVDVDRSPQEISELDESQRNPEWSKETLFLKVEVAGYYTLYSYEAPSFRKYFYQVANQAIKQLIHKKYLTSNLDLATNNDFRQQFIQ